jgi:hypothetical protein
MSGVIDHANLTLKLDVLQLNAADLGTGGYATLPIFLDWSAGLSNGTGSARRRSTGQDTGTLGASATDEPRPRRVAGQRVRRHAHVHEDQA